MTVIKRSNTIDKVGVIEIGLHSSGRTVGKVLGIGVILAVGQEAGKRPIRIQVLKMI